jgi:transglutaminase-like putative cysteine protease
MDAGALREELGLERMPTSEDYPDVDGVVLLDKREIEMNLEGNSDLYTYNKVHKIQKLFRNIESHATVQIPLFEGETITDVRARTIKPDGSNVFLKEQDFYTITGEAKGPVFYSDAKVVRFTFPSVEKGCIIDYEFTKKTQRAFWYDVWEIQNYLPTMKDQYTLTIPLVLMDKQHGLGWTWRYKSYNYPDLPKPVQTPTNIYERMSNNGKVSFTWTLHDIPAFEQEVNMPPQSLNMAYVKFSLSEWSNWDAVSSWYYQNFFEPQLSSNDEIRHLAKELTKNTTTDVEKIQRISKYVQGIRYVAVDLGPGFLQPSVPQLVLERKYGDCKDKAALLISLLNSLRIKADPVLVLTASEGVLDAEFPTWNFNHMIVKTETRDHTDYWIDPTVNYCQIGQLPWQDEGIDVLVIHTDGTSTIEHTPNASCDQNVTDIDVSVHVDTSHDTHFDVVMTYTGEKNFRNRAFFNDYTPKELREFCKELIVDDFFDATIQSCSFTNSDSLACDLSLSFDFTVPDALKKQGDLYFLNIDPFKLFTDLSWLAKENRIYPIDLEYPYTIRKRISVLYPQDKFIVRNIPDKIQIKNEDLLYVNRFSSSGSFQLVEDETFSVQQPYIPAHKYAELRNLFEAVKSRSTEKLIFTHR